MCEDLVVPKAVTDPSELRSPTNPSERVRIRSTGTGTYTTYLIGKPRVVTYSPTGRCTRGFVAFRPQQGSYDQADVHFIKDYWRPDSEVVHTELEVYEKFESIPDYHDGIATVCCGGDLSMPSGEPQVTQTQEFGSTGYLRRIHTRIVLNEVGIPLKDYKNSKELCVLVKQAMRGPLFPVFLTMAQLETNT